MLELQNLKKGDKFFFCFKGYVAAAEVIMVFDDVVMLDIYYIITHTEKIIQITRNVWKQNGKSVVKNEQVFDLN